MKKLRYKIMAVVLALAVVIAGIPVSSYAAWSWGSSQFNYVAVGDTIASGQGLSEPRKQAYPVVAGDLIEDRIGAKVRTQIIDEDSIDGGDNLLIKRAVLFLKNRGKLKDADLISVSVGSTDFIEDLAESLLGGADKTRVTDKLVRLMTGKTELTVSNIIAAVSGLTISEKRALLKAMSPDNITNAIENGLAVYSNSFRELVRYIDEAADDDAAVAFVGMYNPLCVKAYAYYIAALIDGGSYLDSNKSLIDNLVDEVIEKVKSMTLSGKIEALSDYLATADSFFAEPETDDKKAGLISKLILPVAIAFTDSSSVAAMGTIDNYFKQQAEEITKNGDRYYTYVSLSSVPSSGEVSVLPSKQGHRRIAEALVDKVFSKVDFNVKGSGSAKVDQDEFSIEVTSSSRNGGYVVNGKTTTVTLTPGEESRGLLKRLLENYGRTNDSSALYSVKVNGKTVSPKIDKSTGVGTFDIAFEEDTTIDIVFADGETNPVRTGYAKKYNKIVAMGDSIVAGLGLEGFDDSLSGILTLSNAKNSNKYCYPRILEEYFDGKLISNLGNSALTVMGLYAALSGETSNLDYLTGIDLDETYYNVFVNYGEICDADLITLQVGFYELLFGVVGELASIEGVTDVVATELFRTVIKGGTLKEIMEAFVNTMRSETDIQVFSKAIEKMLKVFENSSLEAIFDKSIVTLSEYLPKVVDAIHTLNPDADIALVGYYDPYKLSNIKNVNYSKYAKILAHPTDAVELFTDEAATAEMFSELNYPVMALLMNSVSEKAVEKANSYIRKCADNDPKAIYIDITGINKNPSLSIYPDRQGHIDIADKIVEEVINEVTVKVSGADSDVVNVVSTLENSKAGAEKVITSVKGNSSAKVAVRFGETLRFDLGEYGNDVTIRVDGAEVTPAGNLYLTGNKADRSVEIAFTGSRTSEKAFKLDYYYYPADGGDRVCMNEMMDELDLKAYEGVGYMTPQAPAGIDKYAPVGKKFGGFYIGGCKTARQPGQVVNDVTGDAEAYVNWVDDEKYNDGSTTYNVTVEGGVTADGAASYKVGDKVYVYTSNNDGAFKTWTTTNENLVIVDATSTCAYFFMPGEDVEISAVWEAQGSGDGDSEEMKFSDVGRTAWFYDGVKYCFDKGIMKGISDTRFGPEKTTNRAMVVTMLYRMEGSPDVTAINSFKDVKAGDYFYDPVRWADEKGIVTGETYNVFNPYGPVTREQIAAMLYRYAKYKGFDVKFVSLLYSFADAGKVSDYALDGLGWANYNLIINGVSADRLDPQGSAVRSQVATMMMRFDGFMKAQKV